MNEQINEQLVLLQEELSRLKKVTDHIDGVKTNASEVIKELEFIQKNYAHYTNELFSLYKESIADLKTDLETQITSDIEKIEEVGYQINSISKEQIDEVKKLLTHYKNVVEASHLLVGNLNEIDFPARLDAISDRTEQVLAIHLVNIKQSLEQKIEETKELITEQNNKLKEDVERLISSELKKSNDLIKEFSIQNIEWQIKLEKEVSWLKKFSLIICGLVILSMILMFVIK